MIVYQDDNGLLMMQSEPYAEPNPPKTEQPVVSDKERIKVCEDRASRYGINFIEINSIRRKGDRTFQYKNNKKVIRNNLSIKHAYNLAISGELRFLLTER